MKFHDGCIQCGSCCSHLGSGFWTNIFENDSKLPPAVFAELTRKSERYVRGIKDKIDPEDDRVCDMLMPTPDGRRVCMLAELYGLDALNECCNDKHKFCYVKLCPTELKLS